MPGIYVGNNENLENALRRFKRQIEKGGVLSEIKKKKLFAAKKRQNKKNRKFR
jgi:small subunit ribosomal protein S21